MYKRQTLGGSSLRDLTTTVQSGDVQKSFTVLANSNQFSYGEDQFLVNLGCGGSGQRQLAVTFTKTGRFSLQGLQLYASSMEQYPAQTAALAQEGLEQTQYSGNRITGTATVSSQKLLCISIPYSAGWSAKVDGKPAELVEANGMFLGLLLEPGEHHIELNYRTPGLTAVSYTHLDVYKRQVEN